MSKFLKKAARIFSGKKSRDILPDYVSIGRGTYGVNRNTIQGMSPDAPVSIGNFCSFGQETLIFSKADHALNLPSTYPLRTMLLHPERGDQDAVTKGAVNIGHDVWVGARAMILSGVTIGDGAVIGAGAIVSKNVPPYAIFAGNPARLVRYRFSEHQIEALQRIAWWDWPDNKIRDFEAQLYGDIDAFIDAANRKN